MHVYILGNFGATTVAYWLCVCVSPFVAKSLWPIELTRPLPSRIDYLLSDAKRMNVACNWIVFTHLSFLNDTTSREQAMLFVMFAIMLSSTFSFAILLCWMSCIRLCYQWNMLAFVQPPTDFHFNNGKSDSVRVDAFYLPVSHDWIECWSQFRRNKQTDFLQSGFLEA